MLPEEKIAARLRLWADGEPVAVEDIRNAADKLESAALEIVRLRAICVTAHDRLLRGDSDDELLKHLQAAWKVPNAEFRPTHAASSREVAPGTEG